MNTSRTAAFWRAFGKPALAGLLVLLLLLAALSSASHSVHGWLHQDHQSSSHSCLVTLLEHGHGDVSVTSAAALPCVAGFPVTAQNCETFFTACDVALFPERGPPRRS